VIEADRRVTLIVGAFVTAIGVVLGLVLLFLGAATRLFSERAVLHVRFENVSGLRRGASVQLAGVTVGTVTDVELAPADGAGALVRASVTPAAFAHLHADADATLGTVGLLGDKVVALDPGRAPRPLTRDAVIPGHPPLDLTDALSQARAAVESFQRVAGRVEDILTHLDSQRLFGNLVAASDGVRRLVSQIERGPGALHELAYDAALAESLRTAARGLGEAGAASARAAQRLERASDQASEVIAWVRGGHGTIGGLVYDPGIYESLKAILDRVQRSIILRAVIRSAIKR
jgi:phospholipid/cholesterol/gamma-HCH transport system substrate-binding protein